MALEYKIGADVSDFKNAINVAIQNLDKFDAATRRAVQGITGNFKSIATLEDQLQRFRDGLKRATDPESFTRLQRAIDATTRRIEILKNPVDQLNRGLGGGLVRNANAGAAALNSVGQVARDLPFGFIAIQNNLPIVFDQFGALVKQSGGVVGALKSIGTALIGPAGLTFAIGASIAVVTSLIQKYGTLDAAIDGIFFSNNKLIRQQGILNTLESEAAKQAGDELARLQVLASVAGDVTNSLENRKEAANQLLKVYKEYLPNVSQEALLNNQAAEAIDKATRAIIAKASAAAAEKAIADNLGKQIQLELDRNKAIQRGFEIQQNLNKELEKGSQITGKPQGNVQSNVLKSLLDGNQQGIAKIGKELTTLQEDYQFLIKLATDYAKAAGDGFVKTGNAAGSANEQLRKNLSALKAGLELQLEGVANTTDAYLNLRISIAKVGAEIEKIGVKSKATLAQIEANLKATIESITRDFGAGRFAAGGIDFTSIFDLDREAAQKRFKEIFNPDLFREALKTAGSVSGRVNIIPSEAVQSAIANLNALQTKVGEVSAGFETVFAPAINTIFGALANGQNINEALAQSFKALAVQLGVTLVKALLLAAVISSIPGVGAAFGVAGGKGSFFKIFGSLLGGGLPKFAEGGIVTRPTAGIFGEAGPEAILPLDRLNQLIGSTGGGNVNVTGEFRLRGNELYAIVQQTAQRQGRAF